MGGKTSTQTSQVQIPQDVLARYNSVNQTAQNVAQTPFQQYSTNPSAFVAPLTPTQQSGVANTNAAAGEAQPYFGAATGFALAGAQPVNPGALDTSKYMNPYLQTVLGSTEALTNQANQQAMAGQTGNAINQGYFGGDRSGIAAAVLQGQQNLAAGQVYSGIASDAYQQALAAATQQQGVGLQAAQANRAATQQTGETLAGLGSGAQSAALAGAQAQLGAGQVEQQTQQAGDTALYNQFLQQQSYPFQTAQFLANIAEGTGALSGSTTSSTQPGGLFSDERLKEDMQPIGKGFDGANIYRFRYRDDPHNITRIGFSAQEMEKRHPEAVHDVGGFKAVEQHAATEEAARRGGFALAANDNSGHERAARQAGGGLSEWGSYPEGANPMVIAQLLQSNAQMYAPYAQAGGLYGGTASGAPHGGSSYVPQASLPVGQLQIARPAMAPQPSAMHQAAQDAGDLNTLGIDAGKVYDWGKSQYQGRQAAQRTHDVGPSEQADVDAMPADTAATTTTGDAGGLSADDAGNLTNTALGNANGGFVRAARQDGGDINPYGGPGGLNIPTGGGAPHQLQTAGAPAAGKSGLSSALDTAGSTAGDINNLAKAGDTIGKGMDWLSSLSSAVPFAEGGFARAHRDMGGDIADPQNDIPDKPVGPGLNIPSAPTPPPKLATASPPSQGGGGNSTMSDIMDVAKIAAMFAARGGRIGRAPGGVLGDASDDDQSGDWGSDQAGANALHAVANLARSAWGAAQDTSPAGGGAVAGGETDDPNYTGKPAPAPPPPSRFSHPEPAMFTPGYRLNQPTAPPVTRAAMQPLLAPTPPAGGAPAAAAPTPAAGGQAASMPHSTYFNPAPPQRHTPHGPPIKTGYMRTVPGSSQPPAPAPSPAAPDALAGAAPGITSTSSAGGAGGLSFDAAGNPTIQPQGFANADATARASADAPLTPHAVQHEGGPPLPTVDAQGAPVTPGAVTHDTGFGPAARSGQGGPGGPGQPGAPGQGPGGFLGGIEHALGGFGRMAAGLAGYEGNGQWDRDKLIPAISGIAGMLAAPTKYPLVALTQGLQQGANSYMGMQQKEAALSGVDLQNLQAAQNLLQPNMRNALRAVPGPDLHGGQTVTAGGQQFHYEPVWSLFGSMRGSGQPQGQQGPAGGAGGAGAPPAGGGPSIGQQATGAVLAGQRGDGFKPDYGSGTLGIGVGDQGAGYMARTFVDHSGTGAPPLDASNGQYMNRALMQSQEGDEYQARELRARAENDELSGNPDDTGRMRTTIGELSSAFSAIPESGLLASGPGADAATQTAQFANRVMKAFGLNPDPSITQAGDAKQIIDKLRVFLGEQAARGNNPAASQMKDLADVLPGLETNKGAGMKVLANMMVNNEKQLDFQKYRTEHENTWGVEQGAAQAWRADTAARYDHELQMLPKLMMRPKGKDGAPGGPSIMEQYLAHPEMRERLEQGGLDANGHHVGGLGAGTLRYFAGAY